MSRTKTMHHATEELLAQAALVNWKNTPGPLPDAINAWKEAGCPDAPLSREQLHERIGELEALLAERHKIDADEYHLMKSVLSGIREALGLHPNSHLGEVRQAVQTRMTSLRLVVEREKRVREICGARDDQTIVEAVEAMSEPGRLFRRQLFVALGYDPESSADALALVRDLVRKIERLECDDE